MKYTTTLFKLLMALAVALLPFEVNAAPKKEGKKRASAEEVRKKASKGKKQSEARKSPKKDRPKANKPPQQKRPKAARQAPKRERAKSAAVVERRNKPESPKQPKAQQAQRRPQPQRPKKDKVKPEQRRSPQRAEQRNSRPNIAKPAERNKRVQDRERKRPEQATVTKPRPERQAQRKERPERLENRKDRRDDRERNPRNADRRNERRPDGRDERRGEKREERRENRQVRQETDRDRANRARRAELRKQAEKNRKRQLAQRKERKRDRVQQFRQNRERRLVALKQQRQSLRATRNEAQKEYLRKARKEIRDYWEDRADDIRDRLEDRYDHLFADDWWERRRWRHRGVHVRDPWWWWRPARWSTVNVFLDMGWSEPVTYDYGTDVIYDETVVYVHGEPVGSPVEYSQRVIQLANPVIAEVEAPTVEDDWSPLGVWALVQEDQGDAVMFFQLSVNKEGIISGAYVNVMSGEELPITGQVDRKTQRAAWHIGDQKEKVFEAGMANLTQDQASCLVHMAPGNLQSWLLVRMESPELPDQPATVDTNPVGLVTP